MKQNKKKRERVRTRSFMGQASRRCCCHMAGISAGFEAKKCKLASNQAKREMRKGRKVGMFLF